MKAQPVTAKGAIVVVVPPPVETAANTWIRSDKPESKTGFNDRGYEGKVTRDEIRKEVTRKVPSRQSARPQERSSQPRSHKAGKV